jgi:hypothetical protein
LECTWNQKETPLVTGGDSFPAWFVIIFIIIKKKKKKQYIYTVLYINIYFNFINSKVKIEDFGCRPPACEPTSDRIRVYLDGQVLLLPTS